MPSSGNNGFPVLRNVGGNIGRSVIHPNDVRTQYTVPLTGIRFIRDHLNGGNSVNSGNHWIQIGAYTTFMGSNAAHGRPVTTSHTATHTAASRITNGDAGTNSNWVEVGSPGAAWVQVDLGSVQRIENIITWHWFNQLTQGIDYRYYHNNRTEVSADGVNWFTVFDSSQSGTFYTRPAGNSIRIVYV